MCIRDSLYIDELSTGGGTWLEGQSQNAIIPAEDLTLVPRKGTACLLYTSAGAGTGKEPQQQREHFLKQDKMRRLRRLVRLQGLAFQ